jgi:hypothetical protein
MLLAPETTVMRTCASNSLSSRAQQRQALAHDCTEFTSAWNQKDNSKVGGTGANTSETVFDLLYDEYLPFRLYVDFMLGSSAAKLAKQFGLSEDWVTERIKAIRWCIEKQVRLNLLDQRPVLKAAS